MKIPVQLPRQLKGGRINCDDIADWNVSLYEFLPFYKLNLTYDNGICIERDSTVLKIPCNFHTYRWWERNGPVFRRVNFRDSENRITPNIWKIALQKTSGQKTIVSAIVYFICRLVSTNVHSTFTATTFTDALNLEVLFLLMTDYKGSKLLLS